MKHDSAVRRLATVGLLCLAAVAPAIQAVPVGATAVPTPTVSGPITGGVRGIPFNASPVPLGASGYVEEEYFFTGTARGSGTATAAYTARMLVRRPTDPSRFNGTLVAEWTNVTDEFDNDWDWHRYFPEIIHDGFAFVVVSAQQAGYNALKAWDPVRYSSLNHPGDSYANDIFAQAVQAFRTPASVNPLPGMTVQRALATGDSQSANKLSSYVSSPLAAANGNIDGFMIDSGNAPTPPLAFPTLELRTEGDVSLSAGARDTNTGSNYRLWEVTGGSHVDFWEINGGRGTNTGTVTWDPVRAGQYGEQGVPPPNDCPNVSDLFPVHYAWDAGLAALNRWVVAGTAPSPSPLVTVDTTTTQPSRDSNGNALGGLRYPPIDVPVATYVGMTCGLYGTIVPFTSVQLGQLYPSHQDYVDKMAARTRPLIASGFLLPMDGADLMTRACASSIGGPAASATCPADLINPPAVVVPESSTALAFPAAGVVVAGMVLAWHRRRRPDRRELRAEEA